MKLWYHKLDSKKYLRLQIRQIFYANPTFAKKDKTTRNKYDTTCELRFMTFILWIEKMWISQICKWDRNSTFVAHYSKYWYKCWRRDIPRFVFSGISTSCAVIWWQGEEIFRKANKTVTPSSIWKVSKIDTTDVPGDAMTTILTTILKTILKTTLTINLDWLPMALYGSLWLCLALSCSYRQSLTHYYSEIPLSTLIVLARLNRLELWIRF